MTEKEKNKEQVPIWSHSESEKKRVNNKIVEAEKERIASNLPLGLGWFVKCLRLYAVSHGRARRREYFLWYLWINIIGFCVGFIMVMTLATGADTAIQAGVWLSFLLTLLFLLPNLCVLIRRMHDTGRSGFWVLSIFLVFGVVFLFLNSEKGTNKYGINPKGDGNAE